MDEKVTLADLKEAIREMCICRGWGGENAIQNPQQMAMAMALLGTPSLVVYLPVMIAISIITGLFTGLCAQFLVNRGNLWKTISR